MKEKFSALQVFGSVDADGFYLGDTYSDGISVLKPAELFERFGQLE